MSFEVEISLFGFGDDRPAGFGSENHKRLILDKSATVNSAMLSAGFTDTTGLVLLINDTVLTEKQWDSYALKRGDKLKVLSALEGG